MKDENHHESVDGTLPKFEPLMPGADIPPSELPEQYESHQNIEEFFAKARHEKETSNFRNSISEWKTLVLLIVFLGLFFLIMELDFLPNGLVIPVMLLPTVVGIFVRVFVYGFSLHEAVADCKVHIALSVCFLMIGIMCLF
ncbi:MAG: hypothetical protein J1F04_05755 [Oscillospiraceae bacterium]|nr:hypothetical protein [Oscillospiraceae bacterium]